MQRDTWENHAQRREIIQQIAALRERQINARISLKLCQSKVATDWAIVHPRCIRIRRGCLSMVAVITRVPWGREMVSTRKKVQSLAKHGDTGENAQCKKADRVPT